MEKIIKKLAQISIVSVLISFCLPTKVPGQENASPFYHSIEKATIEIRAERQTDLNLKTTLENVENLETTFSWNLPGGEIEILGAKTSDELIPRNQITLEKGEFTKLSFPLSTSHPKKIEFSYRLKNKIIPKKDSAELHLIILDNSLFYINKLVINLEGERGIKIKDFRHFAIHGIQESDEEKTSQGVLFQAQGLLAKSTFSILVHFERSGFVFPFKARLKALFENLSGKTLFFLSLLFPLLSFLILLLVYLRYHLSQKLKRVKNYRTLPPSNIPPAVLGLLLRLSIERTEIAATILDLLLRGYLILLEKENGIVFGKKKETKGLKPFEKKLMSELFKKRAIKGSLKEFKEKEKTEIIDPKIEKIYREIYFQAVDLKLFEKNPLRNQIIFNLLGIAFFFFSFILLLVLIFYFPANPLLLLSPLGITLASFLIMKLGKITAPRTRKGQKELVAWLEFKNYLSGNYALTNPNKELLKKYLVYAYVLGTLNNWLGAFKKEAFGTPDFYVSVKPYLAPEEWMAKTLGTIEAAAEEIEHLKGIN